MTRDHDTARDDLAFIRAIVEERRPGLRVGGFLYAAAGVIYGAQALIAAVALTGAAPFLDENYGWVVLGANLLYFAVMGVTFWRARGEPMVKGTASRAIASTFAGVGIANAAAALGFAMINMRTGDPGVWFVFPIVIAAFQGAVWYAFAMIARRVWMGAVALGWYATAIVLGVMITELVGYTFVLAGALFALMAAPGLMLMRASKAEA